ncbi:MAG: MarR family winged helix-turn-helix transcriptional regulator [Sporomusaceae bacterium]|nr:MarR family winged helix-turn-helix transcriptional regulator [Sporomusaceae bacterium]
MNLRRAARAVTRFYDNILKPSGLTVAQLALLRHIQMAEKTTISELAKLIRIDRTTLNRNLKPLTDAGLITIAPGEDSRTREISMTQAGQDAIETGWRLWGEAQEAIKVYMGDEELTRLKHLLTKLEALMP